KADLARRMLEEAAGAVSPGLRPDLQLPEFATQREVAEDQEGRAAVAIGAGERNTYLAVRLGDFDDVAIVRPEGGVEGTVVHHPHGEALAFDDILQPDDVFDGPAVTALPAELDAHQICFVECLCLEMLP